MALFGGIDGGQSSSVAVAADENGRILGTALGPPCGLAGEPAGSDRRARTIDALLAQLRERANLPPEEPFTAVVAGVSGYDAEAPPAPGPQTANVRLVHDADIAHAGAFGGEPGIIVVAGTGSVALGVDPHGNVARAGGWGYEFGDEGSALWLARAAIRAAMDEEDGGEPGSLGAEIEEFFGVPSLRALQHAFAQGTIDRVRLAEFAPAVVALAEGGDARSRGVCRGAVDALAGLVRAVARRLAFEQPTIAHGGGLFKNPAFAQTFEGLLSREATVVPPKYPPEIGALLLAYHDAGLNAVISPP